MYKATFIDQCGYLPKSQKKVTFVANKPVRFAVCKSDGTRVFHAEATKHVRNASAGESNYIGDFSALAEEGIYYIVSESCGESDFFAIGEKSYQELFQKSMAFYFLQRCGQDLPERIAGLYAHPACHMAEAVVYGDTGKKVDVTGGWHDAGDYGKYIVPAAMSVAQLLYAWERKPKLCQSYVSPMKRSDEEQAALPDYLEEIKYELDWMCKMQREDGALYHKVTCRSFCGFIMPQDETDELVLSPVSVTATADFAAVTAMAVRFYKEYDAAYASKLEEASRKAYAAMKKMELPGGFVNPEGITTGQYEDANDLDERYWAAAELYKAFGDSVYKNDFEAMAKKAVYHGYGWADMGTYGNLAYVTTTNPVNKLLKKKIEKAMVKKADERLKVVEKDGYGTSLKKTEYIWGCNMNVANNGLHLYDAYQITGDEKYLDGAREQIHYLLGRNPMGLCYVTGCGTEAILRPHHRPSAFVGKAMPGMLSGGPCDWMADPIAKALFTQKTPPAKMIVDQMGSYSTNEVTIYWNSALIALLASVM